MILKSLDDAESQFLACIESDPTLGAAPFNLASLYLTRNEPERALAFMDERGETWPVLRGPALIELDRFDEGIDCLRQGLKEYRSKPDRLRQCRLLLAMALQEMACQIAVQPGQAEDMLRRAEAMAQESIEMTPGPGARAGGGGA